MNQLAFVFPGQGSQTVGMLQNLAMAYPIIRDTFNEASEIVGFDLWALVENGPIELLNQTEHTQVAMLVSDVSIYRLLQSQQSFVPTMMAGHSLGEYAALVCSGALAFKDAVRLVALRGKIMQDTVPLGLGAMAAIVGLNDEEVVSLCQEASNDSTEVTPANYNAIGQIVIAGHTEAVQRALDLALEKGARLATTIPVSVPCHCPLLKPASLRFSEALEAVEFKTPALPVISNVTVSPYESAAQIRLLLAEQLYSPVRFVETINYFALKGVSHVIECGPGKVLAGLIKRIDKTIKTISVNDQESLDVCLHLLQ